MLAAVHVHECSSVGARITPPLPLRPGGDSLGDDAHGDGDGNWGVQPWPGSFNIRVEVGRTLARIHSLACMHHID